MTGLRLPVCLLRVACVIAATIAAMSARAEQTTDALVACYTTRVADIASAQCDAPDIVVQAVYRACNAEEQAWRQFLVRVGGAYGPTVTDGIVARLKARIAGSLRLLVETTRAQKGLCL